MIMKPTFFQSQDGAISALNLALLTTTAIFAGIAIDVSNVISNRTQLQAAADSAAHTAIFMKEFNDGDVSREAAIAVARQNMPPEIYGEVLRAENIKFGTYDATKGEFYVDENDREAVMVLADQVAANDNPVSSFLLQMIGFESWDVRTTSVFETFFPTCLREGFVAEEIVDIQSNNSYFNGFCIHSNQWVELNNNNFFEAGTIVSMPDTDLLVVPKDGLDDEHNEGLQKALREGKWWIKILERLDAIVEGAMTTGHKYSQPFIKNKIVIDITDKTVDPSHFTAGRVHEYTGTCNPKFTFNAGVYEDIVFKTSCSIQFSNGAEFRNAVIITEATGQKSMYAPQNLTLGEPDDCGEGGGAVLISYGDVEVAAKLEMHGSQILSAGDVDFSANAAGIRGASIVAAGRIDGTSNMDFAFCGGGMDVTYEAAYFRLAQ